MSASKQCPDLGQTVVHSRSWQEKDNTHPIIGSDRRSGLKSAPLTFHHPTKKLLLILHPELGTAASLRFQSGPHRRGKTRCSPSVSPIRRCSSCFSSICLHLLPLLPLPPCSNHRAPVLRSGAQRKQGVNPNKIDLTNEYFFNESSFKMLC